jgi:trimeric autotransporter adhesin
MSPSRTAARVRARRAVPAIVIAGLVSAATLARGAAPAAASPDRVTPAAAGDISTVAGGVGGPGYGAKIALRQPCGVISSGGALYIGDYSAARVLSRQTGWLTTPAGTGFSGPLGTGGPATSASLIATCGLTPDHQGNLVIADAGHSRIQVVARTIGQFYQQAMTAGAIYTVAGGGSQSATNGTPALQAAIGHPSAVAVDSSGNLLIAGSGEIFAVAEHTGTFYGQAMVAGDIYIVAGGGTGGLGDGGPATSAELSSPNAVAVDPAGNLVIADTGENRIRVVAEHTGTFYGRAMTTGDIYTVAGDGTQGYSGDGGPATVAELAFPHGVAADSAGNLLIADYANNRVRVVAATTGPFYGQAMSAGHIYTVAGTGTGGFSGDGGPAASAGLNAPQGVAADGAGNLVIADTMDHRVRVVAAATGTFYGRAMTAGNIYTVTGTGNVWFSGDGGPATRAQIQQPEGVAAANTGDLAIADQRNQRVLVTAGATGTFYGRAMTAGHIYTVAGNGKLGFSGDGGPGTSAQLAHPSGVAADGAGNLLIADYGNSSIRVVARSTGTFYGRAMTAGNIYTVAGSAELAGPWSVAVDGAGNVVIDDRNSNRIRVVAEKRGTFYGQAMTAGNIYTVAGNGTQGYSGDGGPALSVEFSLPLGVTVDTSGNLVIADFNRVRVVAEKTGTFYGKAMTAGDVYTVAGDGLPGLSGDGGPAASAEVGGPPGITADGSGNVLITDSNSRVRVIAGSTGTFYGQAMTAGYIYRIAGTGKRGFSGNGGPAISAELSAPTGIAVNAAGGVFFSDTGNSQVRQISG